MGHFDASAEEGSRGAPDSMDREARDPGWYRDPANPRLHRYWDGIAWHPQSYPLHVGGTLPQPRPRSD